MKSLPVFLIVCAFLWWARSTRTPWLFFGWGFLITGLPLLRGLIGPIPIYLFDVAVCLVWTIVLTRPGVSAWPASAPPWSVLFIIVLTLFGTLLPTLTYGFYPEMIWNLGHTGLAMSTIVLGAFLIRGATRAERNGLRLGIAVGLVVLGAIAILEKSSSDWNAMLVRLFYGVGDETADQSGSVATAEVLSALGRVSGPFGSPNTFGIVALMAALNYWLISTTDRRRSLLGYVVAVCLAVVALACGSRQVIIAAGLVAIGYVLTTAPERALPRLLFGAGSIVPILFLVDPTALLGRLETLSAGADEANVAARLSDGPQRFWEMLVHDPTLLFTGVGLEIQKLTRFNVDIPTEILDGFVSNGYLLYIYFFGIFGFLIMAAFWLWVVHRGFVTPKSIRPITSGGALALVFIVFADNHAVLSEELLNHIMIFIGIITALTTTSRAKRQQPLAMGELSDARRAAQ